MGKAVLLQIHPVKHFRLFDALLRMPADTNEIVLHPGRNHSSSLLPGTKAYLWEAHGTDLVGEGTIIQGLQPTPMPAWQHQHCTGNGVPDPDQARVVIRVERVFKPPINRRRIQKNAVLAQAVFFRNEKDTEGTCFQILPEAAGELQALLDGVASTRRENIPETAPAFIEADPVNTIPAPTGQAPMDAGAASEPPLPPTFPDPVSEFDPNANEDTREKQQREVTLRPGQALFKSNLLDAYSKRCAITGCDVEAVLEAAHIRPYRNEECHHITNGLLLRADIHVLFDRGLLAIDENGRIQIAAQLRESEYGASLANKELRLPANPSCRPSKQALALHFATLGQNRNNPDQS